MISQLLANKPFILERGEILRTVKHNNDINTAIAGLTELGYRFDKRGDLLTIKPRGAAPSSECELYTAHSGTFSRFVTAIAALESVPVQINCSDKMATRPMIELFDALRELQVEVDSENQCLPAQIIGPLKGDQCLLDASRSSQYLSALLITAPLLSVAQSSQQTIN